ncbi:hypothetical protein ACFE04_004750 [Oxalis oulophora]
MGAALIELEAKLRSSQGLTLDESRVLDKCKTKALKDFMYGTVFGGTLAFIATWKLKNSLQYNLSIAAGLFCGSRGFSRSLDSCVKDIVSQDEKVYDDSTSEQPKLRLRYRSYFSDNVVLGQKTHDLEDDENAPNNSPEEFSNDSIPKDTIGRKTAFVSRHAPANAGLSINTDPVNDIFGFTETLEESNRTSTSSTQTKVHGHSHKRSRRRRQRRKEASAEAVDE